MLKKRKEARIAMLAYQHLTIIGTSHIAKQSVDEVEYHIKSTKPDIVALELDKQRFEGIQQEERKAPGISVIRRIGLKGYVFSRIGAYVEKKLGESVGTKPGAEMLRAIEVCREMKIQMALIDQDVSITLKKVSDAITAKEKWQFFKDILRSIFFRKKEMKRLGITALDLRKVPEKELISRMIKDVKEKYPNIYTVLIQERNEIMAKRLHHLMRVYPEKKIIAIVGAGHEEEILTVIKKEKLKETGTG